MRRLSFYFSIILHSGLVACSGLVGGDPIVIEYCTEIGNSKSVCSCAAKKLKANAEQDVYSNYIEILNNTKNLSEEHNFEQEAENVDDLSGAIGILVKGTTLIFSAGEEAGLNWIETQRRKSAIIQGKSQM
ncbi:hypothetical protein [Cyanobacterium sp. Dongsha4]|uniref:hypothetical protein n=1 Tax=Cyanobacterium sp. DS4 TaxID=2878255 RepID=UPI002E822295|nr:hypothetical protein [Cyanobacterium sp. Dongsha4]WVL00035.1 hypothetical protein Dongsha4_15425 [Cyanobacterium sp. Dongsha4]